MRPTFPVQGSSDGWLTNPKAPSQFALRNIADGVQLTNVADDIIGQSGLPIGNTQAPVASVTPLGDRIPNVLPLSSTNQMIRVAARRVIAGVHDDRRLHSRSEKQGNPVGAVLGGELSLLVGAYADVAVAKLILVAHPRPAFPGRINAMPKLRDLLERKERN